MPRLERCEPVEHERRVVEPVRVEPAAVDELPRARDDALLVRVQQVPERQPVLEPRDPEAERDSEDGREGHLEPRRRRSRVRARFRPAEARRSPGRRAGRPRPAPRPSPPARARGRRPPGERQLRDRELPRGHVGEERQHPVDRLLVVVRAAGGQEQDLGVEQLERQLELVLIGHLDDGLEPVRERLGVQPLELAVVLVEAGDHEHDAVRGGIGAARENRQAGRVPQRVGATARQDEPVRARALGGGRRRRVAHGREERDPLALRDRLAQATSARHPRILAHRRGYDRRMPGNEVELRASDEERDRIATELARARAEGRITLDELSERLDLVLAARTRADLEPVMRDLPAEGSPTRRPTHWTISVLGGSQQTGRWRIERKTRAISLIGGTHLDLRKAEVQGAEATITCFACIGGIEVIVPEGVDVDVGGMTLIGGRHVELSDAPRRAGTPLIRVRAYAFLGGITCGRRRKKLPG